MIYTKEQIDKINSLRVAEFGVKYTQDDGVVWVGTYSKKLILFSGPPALPVNASEETTNASIDAELNTQTNVLTSVLDELKLKADLTEIQPVSLLNVSSEANQFTQIDLLNLIYEELQLQTKLLKKIQQ